MNFILLSVVCLCSLELVSTDPCIEHVPLTNVKRSALYASLQSEPNICDQNLNESVWYRFQVLPPQRMHDQCVEELRCGTDQPIWFNGVHPTAGDPGPKEVTVCSPRQNDCCGLWTATILVKFCPAVDPGDDAGFYVYRLKRVPNCDMAYCAGNTVVCPDGSVWNPVREKCTELRPNITTPVFEGPTSVRKFLKKNLEYDDFYFTCNVRWSDPDAALRKRGEQFEVVFTFDGQEVKEVPSKFADDTNRNVRLWSTEFKGQVGKTVGCKVRSHWVQLEKFMSQYFVAEQNYFVGIRYSTSNTVGSFTSPRIEIYEKDPALTLYFQSTVPISCPEIDQRTTCKINIVMEDIPPEDNFAVSACLMVFSGLDRDTRPKTKKIKARPTPGLHQRTSVIRFLNITTNKEFFWHGYKLPDISVVIIDLSKTAFCSSIGDPHITTFDQRYYHAYMEGDYLLARSTSPRHFEVHVRHHKCWTTTCNCAVAVREGNNVLGVNACQGPSFTPAPIIYLEDKNVQGASITNEVIDTFMITMPSGVYVRLKWGMWHNSSYFNIAVYLNSEDYGRTTGLCGTFNGNATDDTIPKKGQQADTRDVPVSFTESYKLNSTESFINGHVHPIECLEIDTQIPNSCTCNGKQTVACDAPADKTKAFGTQFTEHCNKKQPNEGGSNRRRRRTIESNEAASQEDDWDDEDEAEETEDEEFIILTEKDIPLPQVDENHGRDVTLQWPTPGGITEAEANRLCRARMEASPVYALCRDQISQQLDTLVTSCVTDVQVSDDVVEAVSSILSEFQTLCVHELETSVVINDVINDTKDQEVQPTQSPVELLLKQVVANICPAQCNGNGVCNNGTCTCNNGFAGEDCSINSRNPPYLASFRKDSLCDGRSTFCSETAIFASNIFRSEKLACKIILVGGTQQFNLGGFLISSREVICSLPAVHRFTNETSAATHGPAAEVAPAPFYRWDIALTNDGSLYSNSLRLTVYDSKCQDCRPDGACIQKSETCVIEGRCYKPGDTSVSNQRKKCVPSKSRREWTLDESECAKVSSATWYSCSLKVLTAVFVLSIGRLVF